MSGLTALVGARRIDGLIELLWLPSEPRSAQALLAACLAEGRGPNQRLPRVGPAVRMGAMGVVIVQIGRQACAEVLGGGEVTALEESARQRTKPQFDLVEPRAMLGREVEHVLVIGIGQKGTPLLAGAQLFFVEGQSVQSSQEFANVQTPVRVQVVEDPMEPLLLWELRRDIGQRLLDRVLTAIPLA